MPESGTLLSGKRCLVLDDEFLIALDIQQTLELAGAEYVAAAASVPVEKGAPPAHPFLPKVLILAIVITIACFMIILFVSRRRGKL